MPDELINGFFPGFPPLRNFILVTIRDFKLASRKFTVYTLATRCLDSVLCVSSPAD